MATAETTMPKPAKRRPSALFYVVLAAVLLIVIQTFELLAPILLSLLLILLISLALNPLVSRMEVRTGRKFAVVLLTLMFFGLIGLTGWAFTVPMKDSVSELTGKLPVYWERLQKPLIKLEQQAFNSEKKLQDEVSTEIIIEKALEGEFPDLPPAEATLPLPEAEPKPAEKGLGSVRSSLAELFEGVAGSFTAVAFNAAQIMIVLITVFFGVIYTLMNPRPIFSTIFSLVSGQHHEQALIIIRRITDFVPRWAGATLLGMATIGFLVFLFMWPIFGFMDALVLGLIAGMLETIPFLGPLLSAVPALLLAFGEGGLTPVWVVVAYMVVQALEGNVIMPMVMAHGMSLHPVAVIFSMLLSVAAFGVLGVLVAAPMVAVVSILHEELYRKRFLPLATDADLERLSRQALY